MNFDKQGLGSRDRIPLGATFSALFQMGPEPHPASYTMGTGFKAEGRGVNHPLISSDEVKERVDLYLYSLLF